MDKDIALATVRTTWLRSRANYKFPKRIAEEYGIAPGDQIDFQPAGPAIRLVPAGALPSPELSLDERLRRYDCATERQREREARLPPHTMLPVSVIGDATTSASVASQR
jgi:hypothetical protein